MLTKTRWLPRAAQGVWLRDIHGNRWLQGRGQGMAASTRRDQEKLPTSEGVLGMKRQPAPGAHLG